MKVKPLFFYMAGIISVTLIALASHPVFSINKFYHPPLHSSIEAIGGMAALNLFWMLFLRSKKNNRAYFPLAQSALISMGLLEIFHSFASPGNGFTWLNCAATLAGGLFFSLIWAPEKILRTKAVRAMPLVALIASVAIGVSVFVLPGIAPAMLADGQFTPIANTLNLLGGGLFLIASGWFFSKYRTYRNRFDEILFANFCLLFGVAGMLFSFSHMWDMEWWIWHFVRLCAYALAIFYMFSIFHLSERTLQESEARYRRLVENSPDLVYIFSSKRGGIYYSQRSENILGYSPEELVGNPFLWHELIHPKDLPHVNAAIREFRQGKSYNVEYRIKDRHDNWHWFKDCFITEFKEGNELIVEGLASDITERKEAELRLQEYADTQAVLLREVNHRVKNNLAIIISMLHKEEDQARKNGQMQLIPMLNDLEGRINGLFTVHSLFSASNWQPLNLSDLCKHIVREVLKPHISELTLEIAESTVSVDSNQAHYLTLVINELATNSLKHAIGKTAQNSIEITIGKAAGKVLLTYRDSGPGYPADVISGEYNKTGIGFSIINGIVKKSLRGTVSFSNENGAVTAISFRAHDANHDAAGV